MTHGTPRWVVAPSVGIRDGARHPKMTRGTPSWHPTMGHGTPDGSRHPKKGLMGPQDGSRYPTLALVMDHGTQKDLWDPKLAPKNGSWHPRWITAPKSDSRSPTTAHGAQGGSLYPKLEPTLAGGTPNLAPKMDHSTHGG